MNKLDTPHDVVPENNVPVVTIPPLSERLWATVGYVALGPLFLLICLEAFFLEDCFVRTHARRILSIIVGVIVASLIPLFYLIATVPHESELVSFDQQLMTMFLNRQFYGFNSAQIVSVLLVALIVITGFVFLCINAIKAIRGKL